MKNYKESYFSSDDMSFPGKTIEIHHLLYFLLTKYSKESDNIPKEVC